MRRPPKDERKERIEREAKIDEGLAEVKERARLFGQSLAAQEAKERGEMQARVKGIHSVIMSLVNTLLKYQENDRPDYVVPPGVKVVLGNLQRGFADLETKYGAERSITLHQETIALLQSARESINLMGKTPQDQAKYRHYIDSLDSAIAQLNTSPLPRKSNP